MLVTHLSSFPLYPFRQYSSDFIYYRQSLTYVRSRFCATANYFYQLPEQPLPPKPPPPPKPPKLPELNLLRRGEHNAPNITIGQAHQGILSLLCELEAEGDKAGGQTPCFLIFKLHHMQYITTLVIKIKNICSISINVEELAEK